MENSGGRRRAHSGLEEPLPTALPKRQRIDNTSQLYSHDSYSVGWVCALSVELGAARGMLDEEHEILSFKPGDNNTYTLGRIGRHNVVLACLPDYGTATAAAAARDMLRSFPNIQIRFMVGIGGGVPGSKDQGGADIRLGDVVVGDMVVQYDRGKAICEGVFERTGGSGRPPPGNLATAFRSLRGHHMVKPSQIPNIFAQMLKRHPFMAAQFSRPVAIPDRLFEAAYDHEESSSGGSAVTCNGCDPARVLPRPARDHENPCIHYGKIASGNKVIKDGVARDHLASDVGAICFEMEAAGLADASFPCLVVRGISDYADSHKNKQWQGYAAATAAAYAKELLSIIPMDEAKQILPGAERPYSDLRADILNSLKFDEMYSRQRNVKKAHPKTCHWLLEDCDFLHWLDPKEYARHHGFLWISGKPGAGKSTLLNFAYSNRKGVAGISTTICFFFNARGSELEKSTAGMYRSLIVQLLQLVPGLEQVLDRHLYQDPPIWDVESLQQLFASAVEKLGDRQLTCFIDALDECDDDQVQEMVDSFESLGERAAQGGTKLYICFSSRHYPHIMVHYGRRLTLEKQPGHDRDLQRYLRNKLKAGASQKVDDVRDEILRKADGVFLWVVLVIDILNKEFKDGRIFAVKKRLQEIPEKLSELFQDMLRRDGENMADLLLCVQWMLFSKRPLRREEFYLALVSGLSPDPEDLTEWNPESPSIDDMNHFVLSSSKGLAEVTEKSKRPVVQFIHESVRDFFLIHNGFRELWPEFGADFESRSHEKLKECCHIYTSTVKPFRHVQYNDDPSPDATRGIGSHLLTKLPFLEYAVSYVLDHADSAAMTIPQAEFLDDFDLEAWIRQRNLFEKFKVRHYTDDASLLYILAEKDMARLIQTVRQGYPGINIRGERHQYPLFAALAHSHRDSVRALLLPPAQFASPAKVAFEKLDYGRAFKASNGETPLAWAVKRGYEELVLLLLDMPDVELEQCDRHEKSLLEYAVLGEHIAIVQLLLDKGASVEAEEAEMSPLSIAASSGSYAAVLVFLEHGADVNSKGQEDWTPLMAASASGCEGIVQLFVERGADIESKDWSGTTALMWAARYGCEGTVQLLVEKGADIESKDRIGDTARMQAAVRGHGAIAGLLLEYGVDVESVK